MNMALPQKDRELLEQLRRAFEGCPRPEHFAGFEHCEECAEHDRTLLSRTPETLAIEDVGNPGWEPICFTSPAGFAYFLPGLARLVFEEPPDRYGWYGSQLLWHSPFPSTDTTGGAASAGSHPALEPWHAPTSSSAPPACR